MSLSCLYSLSLAKKEYIPFYLISKFKPKSLGSIIKLYELNHNCMGCEYKILNVCVCVCELEFSLCKFVNKFVRN